MQYINIHSISSRKQHMLLAVFCLYLLVIPIFTYSQSYKPDAKKSIIRFKIFIDKSKGTTLQGYLKNPKGSIQFNETKPEQAKFDITVETTSISTGDKISDSKIKTSPYLFVSKYKTIRIKSESIKLVSKSSAIYDMIADLTIKGITKKIKIPFTVTKSLNGYLFRGAIDFNRTDFELGERSEMENNCTVYVEIPTTK